MADLSVNRNDERIKDVQDALIDVEDAISDLSTLSGAISIMSDEDALPADMRAVNGVACTLADRVYRLRRTIEEARRLLAQLDEAEECAGQAAAMAAE